jgi:hypothetical protein
VVSATNVSGGTTLGTIRLTLNQAVTQYAFDNSNVALLSTAGHIALLSVKPVASSGNTVFDQTFATQTVPGKYTLYIGPDAMDAAWELLIPYQTQFVLPAK